MKFMAFRFLFILLLLFFFAPHTNAEEDVDWVFGKEPIFEAGPESPEIGTRWALGVRKDDIQITFRLEASTDMKKGGWLGDIRAPEKFYVKFYFVDTADKKWYLKIKNARAVGPDSEYGGWKKGSATASEQMMMYDFSWDKIQIIKDAKTIVLGYSSFDDKDETKDITISMENFTARLGELEHSVRSVKGSTRFVMTKEEIDTTPMIDLPASIREYIKDELARVSEELSMPMSELLKLSIREMKTRQKENAKAIKNAKYAKTKKAHQAIYDQEPEWFDINVCPKPDVGYCNNIGKKAYLESSMIGEGSEKFSGAMTIKYGKILGVIWRSKGSIIEIYPGDIKWNRDPRIYRAQKAEYYYIIKDGDHIKIKPSMDVYAKD